MKMPDMTFNKDNDARLDEVMGANPSVKRGKMFGIPGYQVNGKLAFGLFQDGMVAKVGKERAIEIIKEHSNAHAFEPIEGRVWREWVFLTGTVDEHIPIYEEAIDYLLLETAN